MTHSALSNYLVINSRILHSQIRSGSISDHDVVAYLKDLYDRIVASSEAFILIIDVSNSEKLTAEQRILIGQFIKKNDQLLKNKIISILYVVPTPFLQFILNGIFLFKKPPVPYKVFNRLREALKWAETLQLTEHS